MTRAAATVASDQAQIVAIQRRIADEGGRVRSLAVRENTPQANVDGINRRIDVDEQRIAADRQRETAAHPTLRQRVVTGGDL